MAAQIARYAGDALFGEDTVSFVLAAAGAAVPRAHQGRWSLNRDPDVERTAKISRWDFRQSMDPNRGGSVHTDGLEGGFAVVWVCWT